MKPQTPSLTVDTVILFKNRLKIIKLLGVYSDPHRDPRGHTVSVCYLAKGSGELKSGSDADSVDLFELDSIPELAFDHNKIINDAKSDINAILYKMQKYDVS